MKILLVGATGRAGLQILEEALERGHNVHVIVRKANKFSMTHPALQVWQGMPNDPALIKEAITGCEAVLSAINISRTSDWPWAPLRSPDNLISDTVRQLIAGMQAENIRRIITISAWGANDSRKELPGWFAWLIRNSNIRIPYNDHERHEDLLTKTDLDWTILRPAGLLNLRKLRQLVLSVNGNPKPYLTLSRKQLAVFMLDCLEEGLHRREVVTVSEKWL